MQIQSIKYGDEAQTSLNVTLQDGGSMFVPWPSQTWHNQVILDWIALGNTIAPAFSAEEITENNRSAKIQDLKNEGLARIQNTMPAISSFDMLELVREMWLSVDVGSRNATADFQAIIDIYQAARAGVIFLNSADDGQITAYNVDTSPSWPVGSGSPAQF